MPLARDLSDLPKAEKQTSDENAPDPEPTFLRPFFDHLLQREAEAGQRPHAVEGTRFRHSMAGDCARAVAYHALEVPESNHMDLAGIVVTSNGTTKHDEIQEVLAERIKGFQPEVACKIDGLDGSGSADAKVESDPVICWEHKNIGGYAFKMAVGERGAAQGPKWSHKVQGALNAKGMDADLLVITYLTWEAISVGIAQRKGFSDEGRVAAQWTYTRDEWLPWADAEVERVNGILHLLDEGFVPARRFPGPELPKGATIVDPASGRWEQVTSDGELIDTGTWWACAYCRWQDVCVGTPAGRASIDSVAVQLGIQQGAA